MKTLAADSEDVSSRSNREKLVPLKIYIPDLFIQKSFQFKKDELLWDVKQQIIDSLPKELHEHFNYGLFSPPINGKAGKFLDEHRTLFEYPFSEPVGYLELRYKRRVYKIMNLDEKQIKQLHTRTNLRRMIDFVASGQHEKVAKMCARGMDPNFHCAETGETPLTVAASLKQPAKVILALVNGGSLLDFRTRDGFTAMHRAVQKNNLEALKILLDLGASPNYKDGRGLTPLYHSLLHASDPQLTETLLHDHAVIGTCDHQGWQEIHHACKHGLVQHLEHLLFYGADINARNASGNTPLHVCAVNDQENCARVLLFRGADREALNFANQSAYQVAVIAGNHGLADLIKNHSDNNIVLFRETPRYNPCRRSSIAPTSQLIRACSDPRLESLSSSGNRMSTCLMKPPSPCPSNSSLPPLSSSASCMSETSTSSSSTCCTQTSSSEETASASVVAESGVSDSSGVCTSNSGASFEEQRMREFENSLAVEMFESRPDCLKVGIPPFMGFEKINSKFMQRVEGRREMKPHSIDSTLSKWKLYGKPRTIILRKGKHGFGFVLRGAKATSPLMERAPSEFWPSLQYLEDVDAGGVADLAGLKKGDFVLEINGQDVSQAPHEDVVSIIRLSGDIVMMTVVTVPDNATDRREMNSHISQMRLCSTLPRNIASKKAPVPPKRDPRTTLTVGRYKAQSMVAGLAELEILGGYDSEGHSAKSSSMESIADRQHQHGRSKFASIRARPSSQKITSFDLKNIFPQPQYIQSLPGGAWSSPKVYGSVAAMKRSKALRSKLTYFIGKIHKDFHSTPELRDPSSGALLEIKSHSHENFNIEKDSSGLWQKKCISDSNSERSYSERKKLERPVRVFTTSPKKNSDVIYAQTLPLRPGRSSHRVSYPPPSHPPPPPPISQVIEVNVTKAVSDYANVNVLNHDSKSNVMSSFRPGDSAKLYASPQNVVSIGYKQVASQPEYSSKSRSWESSEKKPYSVPVKISENLASHKISFANSQDCKSEYTTFGKYGGKKTRDSSSSDGSHTLERGSLQILKGKPSLSSGYESKFEGEDSDTSSVQNFISFCSTNHVPFIPEPDYESNEEEEDFPSLDADRSEIKLSTFSCGSASVSKDTFPLQLPGKDNFQPLLPEKVDFQLLSPRKDNVQPLSPGKDDFQTLSPWKDNVQPLSPGKDDFQTLSPWKDNVQPLSPRKEDFKTLSPGTDNVQPLSPGKGNFQLLSPCKDNFQPLSPSKNNVQPLSPGKKNFLQLSTNKDNFPPFSPCKNNIPLLSPSEDNAPPPLLCKDTIPPPSPLKDSIPPPLPCKDSIPSPLPCKDSVPPPLPCKDSVPPPLPSKDSVPPLLPCKDSVPSPVPLKDSIPPSCKDSVPPLSPGKNNIQPLSPSKNNIPPLSPSKNNISPLSPSKNNIPPLSPTESNLPPTEKNSLPPTCKDNFPFISHSEEKSHSSESSSLNAHDEAKHAIQQARERLRLSQKPSDANTTVVFISGRIEDKAERSEIQLHRNEEGRLTGTVVISTTKEPLESSYLPSVANLSHADKNVSHSTNEFTPVTSEKSLLVEAPERVQDVSTDESEESSVRTSTISSISHIASSPIKDTESKSNVESIEKAKSFTGNKLQIHELDVTKCSVENDDKLSSSEPPTEKIVPKNFPNEFSKTPVNNDSIVTSENHVGKIHTDAEKNIFEDQCKIVSAKKAKKVCQRNAALETFPNVGGISDKRFHEEKSVAKVKEKSPNNDIIPPQSEFSSPYVLDLEGIDGLVPPPPEFAEPQSGKEQFLLTLAPPPEFSDSYYAPEMDERHSSNYSRTSFHGQQRKHVKCYSAQASCVDSCSYEKRCRTRQQHFYHERGSSFEPRVQKKREHKEFRYKPLPQWTTHDILDWLDSLFLSEYKQHFAEAGITGAKLANMDSNDLMGLGVKQMGHRLNMERSVKRYLR